MIEQLSQAPISFWIAAITFGILVAEALSRWEAAWSKPALAVYGTVAVWYLGDYVLSEPQDYERFDPDVIQWGFLQVSGFLLMLRCLVGLFVPYACRGFKQTAEVKPIPEPLLWKMLLILGGVWLALFLAAVALHDGEWLPFLWPPIRREKLGMFVHPGIGSGAAFLFAAAGYIQLLVSGLFGTFVILGRGRTRWLAIVLILLSWPYFWFDRIRNVILATILPGVACFWIFSQANLSKKIIISLLLFCGVELWFRQVMAYRGAGTSNVQAIVGTLSTGQNSHAGLDMMKELCWLNTFLQNGRYHANMGRGYVSEVANFVPRTFWPGKPTIGLEYSRARGFINNRSAMGVTATVATGMIGQGLENFGLYFGVVAPAFLMAVWVAILARCWCQREQLPRMLLFLVGMGLTFNLGRDITLLVLFPFVFGYLGILCVDFLDADRARERKKRSASTPF